MEITCGPRDGIEDIIEDRTCHYLFKVFSFYLFYCYSLFNIFNIVVILL